MPQGVCLQAAHPQAAQGTVVQGGSAKRTESHHQDVRMPARTARVGGGGGGRGGLRGRGDAPGSRVPQDNQL